MELVRGDAHVVSEAAVRPGAGQPARHEVDAAVVLGAPAVEAGTAAERGLHQHLVTGARRADAGAQRDDFSAELVAHDEAGRPRVGAVEKASVDVAAADADALDLQQDVARAGTRFGTVGEAHVPRAVEHGGQHGTYNAAKYLPRPALIVDHTNLYTARSGRPLEPGEAVPLVRMEQSVLWR